MKKFLILLSAFLTIANQSYSADATGEARARVLTSMSVTQNIALNFGSFSSSPSAGTINQAGATTGGVTAVSGGETRSAGVFSVSGEGFSPYTFTLPSTATIGIGGSAGTNPMVVTLSFASGNAARTLSSGAESVFVNGNLAVAANQVEGLYTGTYQVTANY